MKRLFIILVFLVLFVENAFSANVDSLFNEIFPNSIITDESNEKLYNIYSYLTNEDPELALELHSKVLKFYVSNGKDTLVPIIENHMGNIYRSKGQEGKAATKYLQAAEGFKKYKNFVALTWNYSDLGGLYYRVGLFDQAEKYYARGLNAIENAKEIAIRKKDTNELEIIGSAYGVMYSNIGMSKSQKKQYDSALYYFHKSLDYRERTNSKIGEAYALSYIARIYTFMDKFDSSRFYYDKLLSILENEKNNYKDDDINLLTYYDLLSYYAGFLYLTKSSKFSQIKNEIEDFYKKHKQHLHLIEFNILMSEVYLEENKLNLAIRNYKEAVEIAKEHNFGQEILAPLYRQLHIMYVQKNEYQNAHFFGDIYRIYQDSIYMQHMQSSLIAAEKDFSLKNEITKLEEKAFKSEINLMELEKQKTINTFLLLFAILAATLLIIIIYYQRKTVSINKQLNENNQQLKKVNQRLTESEKMLTELNNTKDKFFSIIAHDLRSPFSAFKASLDFLVDHRHHLEPGEEAEFLTGMKDQSEQLLELLENLLTWSRTQRKKIIIEPSYMELFEIIESLKLIYAPLTEKKEIEIVNKVEFNEEIFADLNALTAVLRNLISNAIKFSPHNSKIIIGTEDNNSMTQLYVQDFGVGMPQEKIDELFKVASNTSTAGTDGEAGSGLGLIIVKELIEQHGGKVEVESTEGVGTKFILSLPKPEEVAN